MKVLIAIDSSPASQRVLEEVAARPWPSNTAFCITSAVEVGRFSGCPLSLRMQNANASNWSRRGFSAQSRPPRRRYSRGLRAGLFLLTPRTGARACFQTSPCLLPCASPSCFSLHCSMLRACDKFLESQRYLPLTLRPQPLSPRSSVPLN